MIPESVQRLHDEAVAQGRHGYIDPRSGYWVTTTLGHTLRGSCCGNACRHCPFDHHACAS